MKKILEYIVAIAIPLWYLWRYKKEGKPKWFTLWVDWKEDDKKSDHH